MEDSVRSWAPMTAARLAGAIRAEGTADLVHLAIQFADDFRNAEPGVRGALVRERPEITGDSRADALIAGLAEHLCHVCRVPVPNWTEEEQRFLGEWWFVAGLPGLVALALVESPAAFRRRGVFITDGMLASV